MTMDVSKALNRVLLTLSLAAAFMTLGTRSGLCELVTRQEAVAVADLWYVVELDSGHIEMEAEEKAARLADLSNREVLYLLSRDELRAEPPGKGEGPVLAYIVKYKPNGFVVVSGEDRIEPVLVFNAQGIFRFDHPERNFMRHYVATGLSGRWKALEGKKLPVHPRWSRLRSRIKSGKNLSSASLDTSGASRGLYVKWETPSWDQGLYYNETVLAAHNYKWSYIPTGCTATAMAIQMRFHAWPPKGTGSNSYTDSNGSVTGSHSVNFDKQTYDWNAMPVESLTAHNAHVADLMYHCGVAVEMDYETTGSGAWPDPGAMNGYFQYNSTLELSSGHDPLARISILAGLPVILSSHAHTVLACGYRDSPSPYFYLNVGYDGWLDGWYDISQIPGASGPNPIERSYPFSAPNNYVYVDGDWGGIEQGTVLYPFNTLHEGNNAVPAGGKLWIHTGVYTGPGNEPIAFTKAMNINPIEGPVFIQ